MHFASVFKGHHLQFGLSFSLTAQLLASEPKLPLKHVVTVLCQCIVVEFQFYKHCFIKTSCLRSPTICIFVGT